MSESKSGRPKNPTTVRLEKKIKRLEEEIDKLKTTENNSEVEDLNCRAYSVVVRNGHFNLVEVAFDPNTMAARVVSEEFISDTAYRASFELNKMVAYGKFINKKEVK